MDSEEVRAGDVRCSRDIDEDVYYTITLISDGKAYGMCSDGSCGPLAFGSDSCKDDELLFHSDDWVESIQWMKEKVGM